MTSTNALPPLPLTPPPSRHRCPRRVEVWEKLPVSGAGKILKHEIRKKFWAGHEQEKIYGTQGENKKSAYQ